MLRSRSCDRRSIRGLRRCLLPNGGILTDRTGYLLIFRNIYPTSTDTGWRGQWIWVRHCLPPNRFSSALLMNSIPRMMAILPPAPKVKALSDLWSKCMKAGSMSEKSQTRDDADLANLAWFPLLNMHGFRPAQVALAFSPTSRRVAETLRRLP